MLKNSHLWLGDEPTNFAGLALVPGDFVQINDMVFTKAEYGPLNALGLVLHQTISDRNIP